MKRRQAHDRINDVTRGGQTVVWCSCAWRSRPSNQPDIAAREFGRHQVEAQRAESTRHGVRK